MEDIRDACRTVTTTAGMIGMTKVELQKSVDLLQRYGSDRDKLFDEMLGLLAKPDTSSLKDDWVNRCDKAKDLLDHLDHDIPPSPEGAGLTGVGLSHFADGERRVWVKNGSADIASIANIINQLYLADVELIKKCNDDLKQVGENARALDTIMLTNLGVTKNTLKDLTTKLVSAAVPAAFAFFAKDRSTKNWIRDWGRFFGQSMQDHLKSAKQKGAFKKIILQNIELIQKTKDQLSEEWIQEVYKKGEESARELRDAGANNEYKATDWQNFGEQCIKQLAERRDKALEQSKRVFGELLPTFVDVNSRTFATVTSDPSVLADWKSSMQEDFASIDEALKAGEGIINDLAEGEYQTAARETLQEIKDTIVAGVKLFFDTNKDADDEMKQ